MKPNQRASKRLAHCDVLFKKSFDPWYSDEDRRRRVFSATRPDMLRLTDVRGRRAADLSPLSDDGRADVLAQIEQMAEAARNDWPCCLSVRPPVSLKWLEQFDQYYGRSQVLNLVARSSPTDFSNEYLVTCCELGAVIGAVFRERVRRFEWIAECPYWESALFDPTTANVVPVFHWAMKKLSSYGLTDGMVPKVERCIEMLNGSAAAEPVQ